MQILAQFSQARDAFFRQHGYLPNTVLVSATNLQSLRALNPLLVEGLNIQRRRGDEIEFTYAEDSEIALSLKMRDTNDQQ